jgi:hypothetical protein
MYGRSPSLERGEDGEMSVSRKKEADEPEKGTEGAIREGGGKSPPHVRHVLERHDMHARHEHEHASHDYHEHGDKEDMHSRHEHEAKAMHTRHEKEMDEHEDRDGAGVRKDEKKDKILDKATRGGEKESEPK